MFTSTLKKNTFLSHILTIPEQRYKKKAKEHKKEKKKCGVKQVMGFPGDASGKESIYPCRRLKRRGFDSWVGKILWRRKWHPTPVFLPGKSHGQRDLVGYSPWGLKEVDMTEQLTHKVGDRRERVEIQRNEERGRRPEKYS